VARLLLTRRNLLRYGALGSLALACSGVGIALIPGREDTPKQPLQVLGPGEYATVCALAARILPDDPAWPSPRSLELGERIDELLAISDPRTAAELMAVLKLVENGLFGALFDGSLQPFTRRTPEAQDRMLERMRGSRFGFRRQLYRVLLGLITSCYWSDPATWQRIGYPGPRVGGIPFPAPAAQP